MWEYRIDVCEQKNLIKFLSGSGIQNWECYQIERTEKTYTCYFKRPVNIEKSIGINQLTHYSICPRCNSSNNEQDSRYRNVTKCCTCGDLFFMWGYDRRLYIPNLNKDMNEPS